MAKHATSKTAATKVEPAVTLSTVAALYLRAGQVIQLLPISRRSLGNWTRTGVLPCYRIKKLLLFKRADIEAALERFRIAAVGEAKARKTNTEPAAITTGTAAAMPTRKRRMQRIPTV
jgi:hypothetical protein